MRFQCPSLIIDPKWQVFNYSIWNLHRVFCQNLQIFLNAVGWQGFESNAKSVMKNKNYCLLIIKKK